MTIITVTLHGQPAQRPSEWHCENCGQPLDEATDDIVTCTCDYVCGALYHASSDCVKPMPWLHPIAHHYECPCVFRPDICTCGVQPSRVGVEAECRGTGHQPR